MHRIARKHAHHFESTNQRWKKCCVQCAFTCADSRTMCQKCLRPVRCGYTSIGLKLMKDTRGVRCMGTVRRRVLAATTRWVCRNFLFHIQAPLRFGSFHFQIQTRLSIPRYLGLNRVPQNVKIKKTSTSKRPENTLNASRNTSKLCVYT